MTPDELTDLQARNPHLQPDDLAYLADLYHLDKHNPKPRQSSTDMASVMFVRIQTLSPHLLDGLEREYVFALPRKYRFDLAWPAAMLAVEIDGGRWQSGGGRHMSAGDYEKLNLATERGWRVLRYLSETVRNDPLSIIQQIERCLK